MRLARVFLVIAASSWPVLAQAVEVRLGAESQATYDSNVFRESEEERDDISFRFAPTVDIVQQGERLGVNLYYKPMYEVFTTYSDANFLSHDLQNGISYRFSDRTSAELSNQFQAYSVLNFADSETIDEGTTPIPDDDIEREDMFIYGSRLRLHHALSPRWGSDTEVAFDLFDPRERRNSVGSKTLSAFETVSYAYDAANIFGIGAGGIVQMFDEVTNLPASNTYIGRIFGSYTRHFGESTTLEVRAGPAFILTDQDPASGTTQATYPFIPVDEDTTVGALRGGGIPIADAFGQGLSNDTPIAAGSVVVPNPFTCVDEAAPDTGVALLEGDRCSFQLVLRSDVPGEMETLDSVRNSDTDVSVSGSNSGSEDFTMSIFGEVSLTHRWTPNLVSDLFYNRSEGSARGAGGTSISDTVSFRTVWRPSPLWDVSASTSYVSRNSPTDLSRTFLQVTRDPDGGVPTSGLVMLNGSSTVIEDSASIDTQRWDVRVRLARRVTRHITVSAWAGYSDQTTRQTHRDPNDFSNFTAILGFKYDFDPFRF